MGESKLNAGASDQISPMDIDKTASIQMMVNMLVRKNIPSPYCSYFPFHMSFNNSIPPFCLVHSVYMCTVYCSLYFPYYVSFYTSYVPFHSSYNVTHFFMYQEPPPIPANNFTNSAGVAPAHIVQPNSDN